MMRPFRHIICRSGMLAPSSRWLSSLSDLDETIIVTNSCSKRIRQLQEKSQNQKLYLRLAVKGGGCSGYEYKFHLEDKETGDDDRVFEKSGVKVVVDEKSMELVKGSTVDFVQEMMRSSFAVLNNPQSESACGCGSSFAMKTFSVNPALD